MKEARAAMPDLFTSSSVRPDALLNALWSSRTQLAAVLDARGAVRSVSPALRALLGTDGPLEAHIHPQDRPALRRRCERVAHGAARALPAFRARAADGAWRWLDGEVTNLLQVPGVDGLLITVQDVTGRHASEARARAHVNVTRALSAARGAHSVVQVILDEALRVMGAAAGSVFGLGADARHLDLLGSAGYDASMLQQWRRVPLHSNSPATDAVRTGQDVFLDASAWRAGYPHMVRSAYQAVAALPLLVDGRALGSLTLSFQEDQAFSSSERVFLRALADQCAQTLAREQLQDHLQRSVARHRKLTQHSTDFTSVLSRAGQVLYTTEASEPLVGYVPEELQGQNVLRFVHPEDRPAVLCGLTRPRDPLAVTHVTCRFQHKDGSWVWLDTSGVDLTDDPDVGGVLVNAHDITHREGLRAQLQERERAFQHLFDHNPLPIFVLDQHTLEVLEVNGAACSTYGHTREDLPGMTLLDLQEEDREALCAHLAAHAEQPEITLRTRHRAKGGRLLDVIVRAHRLTFRGRTARLAVMEDVTERLAAQRALEASERQFRLLAENSRSMIMSWPADGGDPYVSPAVQELLGYRPEDVTVEVGLGAVHPDDRARYKAFRTALFTGARERGELEVRLRHQDGHDVWVHTTARAVRHPETGEVLEYHSSTHDISERKAAEAALKAQVDRYGHLLDLTEALERPLDPRALAREALERTLNLTGFHAGVVLRHDGPTVEVLHQAGLDGPLTASLQQYLHTLTERLRPTLEAREGHLGPLTHRHLPAPLARLLLRYHTVAFQPIVLDGAVLGTFVLLSDCPQVSGDTPRLLSAVADRVAVALERSVHLAQLHASREETLRAIGLVLECRDGETAGHTDRVAQLTERFAGALGLPEGALDALRWGAYLHDTGKVAIPDRILLKPGALSEEEWAVMRQHPQLGFDVLCRLPLLPEETLHVVCHHHERWDGSGYPSALKGDAIPFGARLFALVDTFDALTSERPYKRVWTADEALTEIERSAGTHFDPQLARVRAGHARLGPPAVMTRPAVTPTPWRRLGVLSAG